MELKICVNREEVLSKLPIMPIVEMCHPGSNWKTFSCKRRINEFFKEDENFGWGTLEESIREAIALNNFFQHNRTLQIDLQRWERLKIILQRLVLTAISPISIRTDLVHVLNLLATIV